MNGSENSARDRRRQHGGIAADIRHHLVVLIRRGRHHARFSRTRATEWEPTRVRNPRGSIDGFFTDETAWTFIADRLDQGEAVQPKVLDQPPGSKAYIMKIDIGSDVPMLYVKIQLGPGMVWGRSFHYSWCD